MKPSQVAAQLVRIATKLQNSKRPDRGLVAAELRSLVKKIAVGYGHLMSAYPNDNSFTFLFTNYDSMMSPTDNFRRANRAQVIRYLETTPDAAVLYGFDAGPGPDQLMAIWGGAGSGGGAFYYGQLPLVDPNDAEGPFVSALEAYESSFDDIAVTAP